MRRIVLAKLTIDEAETIDKAERNYFTNITLLKNQFISEEEKKIISEKTTELKRNVNLAYKEVLKKYKIPYLSDAVYFLDPDTDELIVEVH